jgi:ribonuclease HI
MLLSDTSYDPRVSTLNHIKKLSDLCGEALDSSEVQTLKYDQKEPYPDLAGKIIISCSGVGPREHQYVSSCGIVIRLPGDKGHPQQLFRTLPVLTKDLASYDAIYEGLSYFRTFGIGDARSIEIRTDDKIVADQIHNTESFGGGKTNSKATIHRYNSIKETLVEITKKLNIPIEIVYYPSGSTKDLKQAQYLAQNVLGLANY